MSAKSGLVTMLLSCSLFRFGRTHNQTGKMNKLLSLLLLALAVVSTQGFSVSSGIPVMGGAVGGTLFADVPVFRGGGTDGPNPVFCYRER